MNLGCVKLFQIFSSAVELIWHPYVCLTGGVSFFVLVGNDVNFLNYNGFVSLPRLTANTDLTSLK